MRRRKRNRSDGEAEMLEKERFRIERQYIELEDAILHGQGSAQILRASETLVQSLMEHLTHEEQSRKQISFPLCDDPHAVWMKNMAELLQIEAGLMQGEVYAALRLRSFCKGWLHMQRMWTSIFQSAAVPQTERTHL